jgi:hypothetical protein
MKEMMKIKLTFFWLLILTYFLSAQIVYEPLNKNVYSYLERLSDKGIIEFTDLVKPLSKKYISEKLIEVKNKIEMLTKLEKDELEFFEKDYFFEIHGFAEENINKKYLSYFEGDEAGRFRFFSYGDKTFKFVANPILGINSTFPDKNRNVHPWMGISAYSYLLNNIGISLSFKTHNEKGNKLDIKRDFTPETGIIPEVHDNGKDIAYIEVRSSVSADWGGVIL